MKMRLFSFVAVAVLFAMPSVAVGIANMSQYEREEYEALGGYVKRPNTQKGSIVYVNCQNVIDDSILISHARMMEQELKYGVEVKAGTFNLVKPQVLGRASLFIVNDESLPTLLSAPEDRWAMVNFARLVTSNNDINISRAEKELSRGFALLGGSFMSQFERTITECVTNPTQLDKYPNSRLPFDTLRRMERYLKGYGLGQFESVLYCDACEEGWAPAPVDDVQRRIKTEIERKKNNSK